MIADLANRWQAAFYSNLVGDSALAGTLRDASLGADRRTWTSALTGAVVRAFETIGLNAAAKGHPGTALPLGQQEYLGQDVMVFTPGPEGWRFPIAVCELENAADDDRVAYSLWKTLCIRAQLRMVFCYRRDPSDSSALVSTLADGVVSSLAVADRTRLDGETLVTVGSRNEANTFPYGFFESWKLNLNTGRFERFPRS
jgi:hypothetical protein